jgi:hypothetical protein
MYGVTQSPQPQVSSAVAAEPKPTHSRMATIDDVPLFLNHLKLTPNRSFAAERMIHNWQISLPTSESSSLLRAMVKESSLYTMETPVFGKFLNSLPSGSIKAYTDNAYYMSDTIFTPEKLEVLSNHLERRESIQKRQEIKQSDSGFNNGNNSGTNSPILSIKNLEE